MYIYIILMPGTSSVFIVSYYAITLPKAGNLMGDD